MLLLIIGLVSVVRGITRGVCNLDSCYSGRSRLESSREVLDTVTGRLYSK